MLVQGNRDTVANSWSRGGCKRTGGGGECDWGFSLAENEVRGTNQSMQNKGSRRCEGIASRCSANGLCENPSWQAWGLHVGARRCAREGRRCEARKGLNFQNVSLLWLEGAVGPIPDVAHRFDT